MPCACLVDTTRCIGCRACQVACKAAHGLKGEPTRFALGDGYQNPPRFSPQVRTLVSRYEFDDGRGGVKSVFVKRQCMHCRQMRCADVCAPGVFHRAASGAVVVDSAECIGCAACIDECPFGVPTIDCWGLDTPHLRKCTFCMERQEAEVDRVRVNGQPLAGDSFDRYLGSLHTPACAKACPTGALKFGDRDRLLAEARRRIAARPGRYVDHIYGERELGGMGWLYLASVPFRELGFPVMFLPPPETKGMGRLQPKASPAGRLCGQIGTLAAGLCWFFRRRDEVRRRRTIGTEVEARQRES